MKLARRTFLHLAAGTAVLPAISRMSWAQAYPMRPVSLIVFVPAGGTPDIIARLIGQSLSQRLGQSVVIDNRPGAGGNLALQAVARASARPPRGPGAKSATIRRQSGTILRRRRAVPNTSLRIRKIVFTDKWRKHMVAFTVNGVRRELGVDPNTPLLWVLREHLKLTGTKFGCGIASCGACTVHIDGQATRAGSR